MGSCFWVANVAMMVFFVACDGVKVRAGFQRNSLIKKKFLIATGCFIDLGKLNLIKILLPWSKSVKQTVLIYMTLSDPFLLRVKSFFECLPRYQMLPKLMHLKERGFFC
jgi:hypothetical protein